MTTSFDGFDALKAYDATHGLGIDEAIYEAVDHPGILEKAACYASHSKAHTAFAISSLLLRKNPDRTLISSTIDESIAPDSAGLQLIQLLNATLAKRSKPNADNGITSWSKGAIDTCKYAETNFCRTISALDEIVNENAITPATISKMGFEVFTDQDGTAMLLRKSLIVPSALVLVPLSIDGIPYPSGTIVGVDTQADEHKLSNGSTSYTRAKVNKDRVVVVPFAPATDHVTPARLSLFAAKPEERKAYAVPGLIVAERFSGPLALPIAHIQAAAQQVVAMLQ